MAFLKTLNNYKTNFRISLQRACCGIQKAANDAKMVPKAACGHENCSESWL
jgi:hypothetical protein